MKQLSEIHSDGIESEGHGGTSTKSTMRVKFITMFSYYTSTQKILKSMFLYYLEPNRMTKTTNFIYSQKSTNEIATVK